MGLELGRRQYASGDYTDLLKVSGIQISMSRSGNPYNNAQCESFMKTFKYEEVYRSEYRDLAEGRAQVGAFLDDRGIPYVSWQDQE